MLKKLYSHDFRAIGKTMWLFTIIVFITTAAGCGSLAALTYISWDSLDIQAGGIYSALVTMTIISFIAIIAYGVIAAVSIISRFYTNLFTDEGYLTFTLPVKTGSIYDAKFLSGCVWMVITSVVEVLCLILLAMFAITFEELPGVISDISTGIRFLLENTSPVHIVFFIIEFVLICILSLVYQIALLYLSVTIASIIAKKARFVVGTAFYFIANSIVSTVSSVLMVLVGVLTLTIGTVGDPVDLFSNTADLVYWEFHGQFIVNILVFGGAFAAGYFVNKNLLKKKLNLP